MTDVDWKYYRFALDQAEYQTFTPWHRLKGGTLVSGTCVVIFSVVATSICYLAFHIANTGESTSLLGMTISKSAFLLPQSPQHLMNRYIQPEFSRQHPWSNVQNVPSQLRLRCCGQHAVMEQTAAHRQEVGLLSWEDRSGRLGLSSGSHFGSLAATVRERTQMKKSGPFGWRLSWTLVDEIQKGAVRGWLIGRFKPAILEISQSTGTSNRTTLGVVMVSQLFERMLPKQRRNMVTDSLREAFGADFPTPTLKLRSVREGLQGTDVGGSAAPALEFHSSDFVWESILEEGQARVAEQLREAASLAPYHGNQSAKAVNEWWASYHAIHQKPCGKEKRYLLLEFPILTRESPIHVAEIGCGCGSALIPVLKGNPTATVTACDISEVALQLFRENLHNAGVDSSRVRLIPVNAASPPTHNHSPLAGLGADVVLLVHTLGALLPSEMPAMLRHARAVIKPGGLLLVRDYGLYDCRQLRRSGLQVEGENLYRRPDGTLLNFFNATSLAELAQSVGFEILESKYICTLNMNRKTGQSMKRVMVHGVFRRPA